MPRIQGRWPKSNWSKVLAGEDQNGRKTVNNVQNYRGMPYCAADVVDKKAYDYNQEVAKQSRQKGLRVVAIALTTSTITPAH